MKADFKVGVKKLCGLFGKTRHAFYDKEWTIEQRTIEYEIVLQLVEEQRQLMPRIGTPKLHSLIEPSLKKHQIKMGIKKLHELLSFYGITVRSKRRRTVTTMSRHWLKKYPNLIREIEVRHPEEIWVADITYLSTRNGFCYLSLITDAYSKVIMGYCLYQTLERQGPLNALEQAFANRKYPQQKLIHHSDRGIQYCCNDYIQLLADNNCMVSMTENGDPYENAIAERVNGILKAEFYLDQIFDDLNCASHEVDKVVGIYNNNRPHSSCDYLTPNQAHQQSGVLKKRWKNYKHSKEAEPEALPL